MIWGFVENVGVRTMIFKLMEIGALIFLAAVTAHLRRTAHGGDSYVGLPA